MKTFKRFSAILIAVFLMVSMMVIPASAAKITINNATTGHTYEAYQIFDGDLNGETLSNIVWGSGINKTAIEAISDTSSPFYNKTAAQVAGTLSEEAHAKAFALAIAPYLADTPTGTVDTQTNSTYVIDNLDPGYYLIKDKDDTLNDKDDAYTRYIIQILGDITIDPKSSVPTVTKGVSATADSKFENYKEAISASIGDEVYYAITASMHSRVNDYADCYYQIVDEMPASLTFDFTSKDATDDDFLGVYLINGSLNKEIDKSFYSVEFDSTRRELIVTFKDIHAAIYAATSTTTALEDKLVISYKATLNSGVVCGVDSNNDGLLDSQKNTAVLYYSNDPNEDYDATTDNNPDSLGKTDEAEANVYSYILKLYKIDAVKEEGTGNDIPLAGATFKLHILENGTTPKYLTFSDDGKFTGYVDTQDAATLLTTGNDGYVTVQGLASGTYHFEEISAPAGYNLLGKEVKVQFSGKLNQATGDFEAFTASQEGGSTVTADKAIGTATVTVLNHKGSTLPSTGGIGTTIFYGIGGVLVIGALSLLIVRKRTTAK